jgi:predicted phage tail component-like protein
VSKVFGILPANATGFTFDNQHSGQVYNLWLVKSTISLLPSTRDQFIEIPGLHGVYDFDVKYDARKIILECVIQATDEEQLRSRVRNIARWLNATKGIKRLVLDKENDKYYLVRYSGTMGIEQIASQGSFGLSFIATDPFAYSIDEASWTGQIASGNFIDLTNLGTFSTPVWFKVTAGIGGAYTAFPAMGLGVCPEVVLSTNSNPRFTLNSDKELKYNGNLEGTDELTIDMAKFEAKKNGANVLGAMEGEWFELEPGVNTFKYDDDGWNTANFEIKFRGRWL